MAKRKDAKGCVLYLDKMSRDGQAEWSLAIQRIRPSPVDLSKTLVEGGHAAAAWARIEATIADWLEAIRMYDAAPDRFSALGFSDKGVWKLRLAQSSDYVEVEEENGIAALAARLQRRRER